MKKSDFKNPCGSGKKYKQCCGKQLKARKIKLCGAFFFAIFNLDNYLDTLREYLKGI